MSRETHEAYAYLRQLGVHPPRRHVEARRLARRLRKERKARSEAFWRKVYGDTSPPWDPGATDG